MCGEAGRVGKERPWRPGEAPGCADQEASLLQVWMSGDVQRLLPGAANWRELGFTFRQRVTFFVGRTSSPSVVEENSWLPPTRGILEGGEP